MNYRNPSQNFLTDGQKDHIISFFYYIGIFLISFTVAILTLSTSRIKYLTYDEVWFSKTGFNLLKNAESSRHISELSYPPLIMTIQAMPSFVLNHTLTKKIYRPVQELFPYTYNNHKQNKRNLFIFRDAIFWFRTSTIFLWFFLLIVTYLWSKNIYGYSAGFLALFVLILNPNLIAHSSIATADFGCTTFMCLALYCFYKFLKKTCLSSMFVSGISLGLALASKYHAIELLLIYLILMVVKVILEKLPLKEFFSLLGWYFLIVGIASFTLSFIYFELNAAPSHSLFSMIIPYNYIKGLTTRIVHFKYGTIEHLKLYFLIGNYSNTGWWYYFLVVFLIKTSLTLLILCILRCVNDFKDSLEEAAVIIPVVIHMLLISLFNHINTGVRHMLFIYPLLIIWTSQLAKTCKNGFSIVFMSLILCWYGVQGMLIFPNYSAYFNGIIGGPKNGYKYLADTNIDSKQDEIMVYEFIQKHPGPIYVNPSFKHSGIVIVSAEALIGTNRNNKNTYNWLKKLSPVDTIGNSWLVYHVP